MDKAATRKFIKENKLVTAQDAQNALKNLFAETIQEMLEAEMDTHLGYQKHEVENKTTTNSRNGKRKKRVTSEYGELEISVPRCEFLTAGYFYMLFKKSVGITPTQHRQKQPPKD